MPLFLIPFLLMFPSFFFFNDTATTEIYTLPLHDALPISPPSRRRPAQCACRRSAGGRACSRGWVAASPTADRKSTRLNSSHSQISYAVFCLKKKKLARPCTNHSVGAGAQR